MFVYSIKSKYFAKYDPYWIGRLLGFKTASIAIALCILNGFFFPANSPSLYFLNTIIAASATEILPVHNRKQQLILFWKLKIFLTLTTIIFGFISYFDFIALAGVTALTYLFFRFLTTNAQTAAVPALLVMFGIIGIEGGITDLNLAANGILFNIQYGIAASIVILFFPNFRDKTFKSALLRLLEKDSSSFGGAAFTNDNKAILGDLAFMKGQLSYLSPAYWDLYEKIIAFQISLAKKDNSTVESTSIASMVSTFSGAVSDEKTVDWGHLQSQFSNHENEALHCMSSLADSWNQACKA